jgi:hypothetical protein
VLTDGQQLPAGQRACRVPARPPDGGRKEITWNAHEIWRASNGRLAEQWSIASGLDFG